MIFSCGANDLKKQEMKKKAMTISGTCKLQVHRIEKVLQENIDTEIDCIQTIVELFIELVETQKEGYLSREKLIHFIKQQMPDVDSKIEIVINSIFAAAHLFFAEDANYIQKDQIVKIIQGFKKISPSLIVMYRIFDDYHKRSLDEHLKDRKDFDLAVENIVSVVKSLRKDSPHEGKLDLVEFFGNFINTKNHNGIMAFQKFLVFKKMLLGGDSKYLRHSELDYILSVGKDIFVGIHDLIHISVIEFKDEKEQIDFYYSLWKKLSPKIVKPGYKESEIILTKKDLFDAFINLKRILKGFPDIEPYKDIVSELLNILITKSEDIQVKDMQSLIGFLDMTLNKMYAFSKIYEQNQNWIGEFPNHVIDEQLKNLPSYSQEAEFFKVIQRYKRSKGSNKFPYYDEYYHVNLMSVLQPVLFENVLSKVVSYFEENVACDSDSIKKESRCQREDYAQTLHVSQLEYLLNKFSNFLIKIDFIEPSQESNKAGSFSLLASLFLSNSNGDQLFQIPELVDLVSLVLDTTSPTQKIKNNLKSFCAENKNKFEMACVSKNIFPMMWDKNIIEFDLSTYMPLFHKYSQESSGVEINRYLDNIAGFTRTCHLDSAGEVLPLRSGELNSIFLGMMFVENLFIRFDDNKNNQLEPEEVDSAYNSLFKGLLGAFLPAGLGDGMKYKIFQYLIKYQTIPKTGQALGWIFRTDKFRKSSITRAGLASIMNLINKEASKASLKNKGIPPYNCDRFK